MKQGLGRCVLALRNEKDITKYKNIVLWGCLHDLSFDAQCEGTRAAYVYELASYFHDDAYFVYPTVDAFFKVPRQNDRIFTHLCELLMLFAESGNADAETALHEKYTSLLSLLANKRRTRTYDYERDRFELVCIALSSVGGRETLLKIADDLGALFRKSKRYDSDDFMNFFRFAERKFGKKRFSSFLRAEAKNSENILLLYEDYIDKLQSTYMREYKQPETPTVNDIVAQVAEYGKIPAYMRVRFSRHAAEDDRMQLAQCVLDEPDLYKKAQLLYTFLNHGFPLDHKTVIEYSGCDNDELQLAAFEVLINCKSEAVRQYAHELFSAKENMHYAIQMLISNYTPDDKDLLLSALHDIKVDKNDTTGWHGIGFHIITAFDKKAALPKEFLLYIYETTLCSCCREKAVRHLAKRKWLTEDIIRECRCDSNKSISEYICRRYPAK